MKYIKPATIIAYFLTIPVANWLVANVGTQFFPGGPHTIPVFPGYRAPSGVIVVGVALVLRDMVQNYYGKNVALASLVGGIGLSYFFAPNLAVASAVAFAVSELLDFVVYTRVRRRSVALAVAASGTAGAVLDSFVFLQIAFGSVEYWQGQVIGKAAMSLAAAAVLIGWRRYKTR